MTTSTEILKKELEDCRTASVEFYQKRQVLQQQLQQIQLLIQQTEMEMLKLDGKEEILHKLIGLNGQIQLLEKANGK